MMASSSCIRTRWSECRAKVDCPEWIECVIYRKDRSRPIRIKEFIDEVYREPFQGQGRNGAYTVDGPWQTHTKRQLRHKSLIQCSRVAFGFSGIYDQDEAERIREMEQASAINPAIANLPSPSQVQSQEPLAIEHKELDPILTKLANRAIAENAWSAAHEYVKDGMKVRNCNMRLNSFVTRRWIKWSLRNLTTRKRTSKSPPLVVLQMLNLVPKKCRLW